MLPSASEHTINDNDAKLNVIMCNTFATTCDNVKILQGVLWYLSQCRRRRCRCRRLTTLVGILRIEHFFTNYGPPPYNQPIIAIR